MLTCRSCLLDCLRAVAGETLPIVSAGARFRNRVPASVRTYATALAKDSDYVFLKEHRPGPSRAFHPFDRPIRDADVIIQNMRSQFEAPMTPQLEREVAQELKYLKDPLALADQVRYTLRGNDLPKALGICRLGSKSMECTVGWNHVIDFLMARKDVKTAFKVYNEMKKRGLSPDSHTALLLLRGLANPPHQSEKVGQALSLYHSLDAPNSTIKRSIIHTNAALKVCARNFDMDSLWGVVSRIPDKGPGSADTRTFTTILNALRENVVRDSALSELKDNMKEHAISDAKKIWTDIIRKWRAGNLDVDEELVCAMGRMMLIGSRPRDWDDVLSLFEQTMDITRLVPKLGTETRSGGHIKNIRVLRAAERENKEEESEGTEDSGKEFQLLKSNAGQSGSGMFAKPGTNSLSLILEACQKTVAQKVAHEYWELLTQSHELEPDLDNHHMYLRILRQSRGSSRAVELIRPLMSPSTSKGLRPERKTFRIAMSACLRDKNNHHALSNAGSLMDFMEVTLSEPDPKTMSLYLELALHTQSASEITKCLERLAPHVRNLKSWISYGSADHRRPVSDDEREDAMALIQTMIGTMDQLIQKALVPREDFVTWGKRRSSLAAFVTRQRTKQMESGSSKPRTLPAPGTSGKGKYGAVSAERSSYQRKASSVSSGAMQKRGESRQLGSFRRTANHRESKAADSELGSERRETSRLSDTPWDIL